MASIIPCDLVPPLFYSTQYYQLLHTVEFGAFPRKFLYGFADVVVGGDDRQRFGHDGARSANLPHGEDSPSRVTKPIVTTAFLLAVHSSQ
jgi:hypothetical protein